MYGYQAPSQVARAPREAWQRPARVEPLPGTPYGLVIYGSPPVTAAPAVGSLVAGIAALAVALLVTCFGLAGAAGGWGAWVAGAFAVLGCFLGGAGGGLGIVGLRRTRRPAAGTSAAVRGRGMAIAGLVCGAVAVVLTIAALGLSVLVAVTN